MTSSILAPGLSAGWRALIYGTLGGIMMIVLEFLVLTRDLVAASWPELGVQLMLQWIPAGIAIALFALRKDGRAPGLTMAALLVVFAAALSAIIVGARVAARDAGLTINPGPLTSPPALTSFLYTFWITLFYGGLFMIACVQSARAERTRNALGRAEIERQRGEALLGETALQALKARVDPEILLRAVAEIAQRYDADPAGADRLLEALVTFLRCAMPSVRNGQTTLHEELRLAKTYGHVWAEVDPQRARWCIIDAPDLDDAPFPGLWVAAALDRWASVAPALATCDVHIRKGATAVSMVFDSAVPRGRWVTEDLERRLRVGLRSTFGDAAKLALRTEANPDAPALSLMFPFAAAGQSAAAADRNCAEAPV